MTPEQIELIREELWRMAKSNREEWLRYENHIHHKYFEPFDRLLEKKAEYYLKQVENGNENKWLLQEIEILEQFRDYVAILETVSQTHLERVLNLGSQVVELTQRVDYLKNLFRSSTHAAWLEIQRLKRLQEQCQHQP